MTTVNFYSKGFFGYSKEQDFFIGSIWHFIPIILMIVAIILIYKYRKQLKKYKYESTIRYVLAFVMLIVEMSYFWRLLYVGSQGKYPDMMLFLPIQMCQWGLILTIFTLTSKNKKLFSFNFYITLLFATIALIYPKVILYTGPTYYRYYQFWLEHILPIISIFYLMFVHKLKPDYKGIFRTYIAVTPLVIVSVIANAKIPNAEYLYLTMKVPFLPDNQIAKIPILVLITMILFHIMYFIFYKIDNRKKSKKKKNKKKKVKVA